MAYCYDWPSLENCLIVGVTPVNFEWYPMPNGANNQDEAVAGQREGVEAIDKVLTQINRHFSVSVERTALVGFSAGAVMAIQAAAHLPHKFAAVVSHAGAILDPEALPASKNRSVPIYLFHNRDDSVFSWEERFLPMKEALERQRYNVKTVENPSGNHVMCEQDLILASGIVAHHLGLDEKEDVPCTTQESNSKGSSSS
jgi:phospholipase/carboxylesterase